MVERKPTADQQLTSELDQVLAGLDELQGQLTGVQQEPLPTDVSQATDMIRKHEVLSLISNSSGLALIIISYHLLTLMSESVSH